MRKGIQRVARLRDLTNLPDRVEDFGRGHADKLRKAPGDAVEHAKVSEISVKPFTFYDNLEPFIFKIDLVRNENTCQTCPFCIEGPVSYRLPGGKRSRHRRTE